MQFILHTRAVLADPALGCTASKGHYKLRFGRINTHAVLLKQLECDPHASANKLKVFYPLYAPGKVFIVCKGSEELPCPFLRRSRSHAFYEPA